MMEKENQQERYMTVEQALKIIPIFNEESTNDNHAFQNSCEFALQNIDPRQTENFVRGITTRLVGKAYRPFRYKKVTSYQEIKSALDAVVSKRSTLAHLHSKLSMLRMMVGESIQQYSDRAEQLFYDILEESVTTGGLTDIDGITRITSKQVLTAFMEGLPHDTRIIVKAAKPDDLEEAVQYAIEEETTRASQQELRRDNSDQKSGPKTHQRNAKFPLNGRQPGACFLCGRTNHQARQCRASEADKARHRNTNHKPGIERKEVKIVTCNYCKKPNHTIAECRKRKYVNERKAQGSQGQTSGNEPTPGPSGGCSVKEIKTATFNLQGLSISNPN